jgi:hypothetical protein
MEDCLDLLLPGGVPLLGRPSVQVGQIYSISLLFADKHQGNSQSTVNYILSVSPIESAKIQLR